MRSKKLLISISRSKRLKRKVLLFEPQWERTEKILESISYGPGITLKIVEHEVFRKHEKRR